MENKRNNGVKTEKNLRYFPITDKSNLPVITKKSMGTTEGGVRIQVNGTGKGQREQVTGGKKMGYR